MSGPRRRSAGKGNRDGFVTRVGSLELVNPVMTAAGTAGHGAELGDYFPLADLGAVVVKSLSAEPWAGNPPPRLHPTAAGMLNSVGLQGPGVAAWLAEEVPALEASGATVVASLWGRTVAEFAQGAALLAAAPACVVAVEVNVSCPNLDAGRHLFAHDPDATAAVIEATRCCGRPRWAKLSPNTDRLVAVAGAALEAGAEAVTIANTLLGMVIDVETRRPVLGGGGGGLSGPAIHPIAVRAVYEVRAALGEVAIVGAGGVANGVDAVEFLLAGACAIQVGTAIFADPHAPIRVLVELVEWCHAHHVKDLFDLVGAAHR